MAKCLAIFLRLTTTPTAKPMSAAATYGYAAAKRHAMATYSKREVEVADRCVRGVRGGHRHKRKIKKLDPVRGTVQDGVNHDAAELRDRGGRRA
jgi:hypothetical protein